MTLWVLTVQRHGDGCSDGSLCWRRPDTQRSEYLVEYRGPWADKLSSLQDIFSDANNVICLTKKLVVRENSQPTACYLHLLALVSNANFSQWESHKNTAWRLWLIPQWQRAKSLPYSSLLKGVSLSKISKNILKIVIFSKMNGWEGPWLNQWNNVDRVINLIFSHSCDLLA